MQEQGLSFFIDYPEAVDECSFQDLLSYRFAVRATLLSVLNIVPAAPDKMPIFFSISMDNSINPINSPIASIPHLPHDSLCINSRMRQI